MVKFLVQKHMNSLRPVDRGGEDAMSKLPLGKTLYVEIRQPRNVEFHRKFFALMNLVYENMDEERYPSLDDFVGAIKIAAGHRTRIEMPNGDVGFMPKSISFAKMKQDEFNQFYDKVCDLIAKHFLPGVTAQELHQEVSELIGISK